MISKFGGKILLFFMKVGRNCWQ